MIHSFFQEVAAAARLHPERAAVAVQGREIGYPQFARDIDAVTRGLARAEIPAGTRVMVGALQAYEHWLVLIALMRLGLPSTSSAADKAVVGGVRVFVGSDAAALPPGLRFVAFEDDWMREPAEPPAPFAEPLHDEDAPCRMLLSSGTTGTAKLVILGYRQVRTRYILNATLTGVHGGTRFLSLMRPNTPGGFTSPLSTWYRGGTVLLDEPGPQADGASLVRNGRATVLLASPAQLSGMLEEWPAGHPAMGQLDVLTGGSALPDALGEAFRLRVSPRLFVGYGSTECSRLTVATAAEAMGRPGFAGYAPSWAQMQAVDDEDRELPAGQVGRLRARVAGMAESYPDDPRETAARFKDGWFYPGDLCSLDARGGLTIIGRTDEVLNIGGVKMAPDRIDEVLSKIPGVKDLASFGLARDNQERLWIAVVALPDFDERFLLAECRKRLPTLGAPSVVVLRDIPRTELGKPQRAKLREMMTDAIQKGLLRRK